MLSYPKINPSLKLSLPLKNRFLPLQESTNAPATHAPLSPEMRPDVQCGQRRNNNQSPLRRAEKKRDYSLPHTSTLPLSDTQIADSPQTLPWSDAQATVRAQVEKKQDYSLPHTSTLPLSDTQIADRPQTRETTACPTPWTLWLPPSLMLAWR